MPGALADERTSKHLTGGTMGSDEHLAPLDSDPHLVNVGHPIAYFLIRLIGRLAITAVNDALSTDSAACPVVVALVYRNGT